MKKTLIILTIILFTGLTTADVTFDDSNNIQFQTGLDLNDNSIVNYYDSSACGSNEYVEDIQDDGTLVCDSVSTTGSQNLSEVLDQGATANQNIAMNGYTLTGLANPSNNGEPVTLDYLENQYQASGSQNLSEVLEEGNVANQSIDLDGNNILYGDYGDTVDLELSRNNYIRNRDPNNLDLNSYFTTRILAGGTERLSINRNGVTLANGNFSANGNSLTDIADPNNAQDAATKAYVDDNAGGSASGLSEVLEVNNTANQSIEFGGGGLSDGSLSWDLDSGNGDEWAKLQFNDASGENAYWTSNRKQNDSFKVRSNAGYVFNVKDDGEVNIPEGRLNMNQNKIVNLAPENDSLQWSLNSSDPDKEWGKLQFDDVSGDQVWWTSNRGSGDAFKVYSGAANGYVFNVKDNGQVNIPNGDFNVTGNATVHGEGGLDMPNGVVIGEGASTNIDTDIAIGEGAEVSGSSEDDSSVAIGRASEASSFKATAVGDSATASNFYATAIGPATASDERAVAIGPSTASGEDAVGISNHDGNGATGDHAIAMGSGSEASAPSSIAIGGADLGQDYTTASAQGAVAIGYGSTSDESYTAKFGSSSQAYDVDVTGNLSVDGNVDSNDYDISYSTGHTAWASSLSTDEVNRWNLQSGEEMVIDRLEVAEKGGGSSNLDVTVTDGTNSWTVNPNGTAVRTGLGPSVEGSSVTVEVTNNAGSDVTASITVSGEVR